MTALEQLAREWLEEESHDKVPGRRVSLTALLARVQHERDERWERIIGAAYKEVGPRYPCVDPSTFLRDEILRRAKQDEGSACADRAETVEETHRRWAKL